MPIQAVHLHFRSIGKSHFERIGPLASQPIKVSLERLGGHVTYLSVIRVVLLQLFLIRLEAIGVIRTDHPLKVARRMRQDIRARFVRCEVGRYRVLGQARVVGGCTGMAEGEEAAVRVSCVVRVILLQSA